MVGLFFLEKGSNNILPLLLIIVSFISFEVLNFFYNLSLHKISKRSIQGAVSNLGWASGYVGGLLSLLLTFIFIKITKSQNYEFLGFSTFLFIGPFVAFWCLIFGRSHLNNFKGKTFLIPTIKNILPELKNSRLPWFLLGYFFFNNGVICIFVFASMFASILFGLKETEILLMGVFINLRGVLGCLVLGRIDDKVGSEKIVISCSLLLFFLTFSIYFVNSVYLFWIIAILIGFFVGPIQASSRSVIAKRTITKNQTVSFSIFTIFGSLCSIFGPFLVGIIIDISDSIRLGLCIISLFFIIPVLLYTINRY
jgi:UMF1 family MFS transporter